MKKWYKDQLRRMSKSMGIVTMIVLIIDAVIMTVAAVCCIGLPKSRVVGTAGTIFFALELLQLIVMLKYEVTNGSSE